MARLPQGVRVTKNGRYEKRFTVDGVRYSVYGKTAKECIEKELEKRKALEEGSYRKNSSVTFDEYFKEWSKSKAKQITPATMANYLRSYRKHIKKAVGACKVQKIERRQIIAMRDTVAETAGVSAGNMAHLVVLMVFKSAVLDEIIKSNPAENIPRIRRKGAKITERTHKALTADEVGVFLNAMKESWYYNAFRFLLSTGVRCGECGALRWNDIDYTRGVIHIRRTITRNAEGNLIIGDNPKTEHSTRDIPLNAEIKSILEAQREQNKIVMGGVIPFDRPIFTNTQGGLIQAPVMDGVIKSRLSKVIKEGAKIHVISVHALRDTFASICARNGVPMNVLKELLGHTSYAMTADRYAQVYEDEKKENMERMRITGA
jgi:integrase